MTKQDLVKVAPENGMPAVGRWKPTWCDELPSISNNSTSNNGARLIATMRSAMWETFDRGTGVAATCDDPDDAVFQDQVGMYLQLWSNETGATGKQLAEMFALRANQTTWEAQRTATCDRLPRLEGEETDRNKQLRIYQLKMLGCQDTPRHLAAVGSGATDDLAHFDQGLALPSQLDGVARMLNCFGRDKPDLTRVAGWALCRHDLAQLDQAKLEAELKAGGHNAYARIMATQALAYVRMRAREYEAALQTAVAKDPEIKKVLIEVADGAWKQWETDYATNKAAVDAAFAYEDKLAGPRKSATKGCFAGLADHMKLAMQGKKATSVPEAMAIATSGFGPLYINHLATCMTADLPESTGLNAAFPVFMLQHIMAWGPAARGPRTAVVVAMNKAAAEISADRPKFPLKDSLPTSIVGMPGVSHGQQEVPRPSGSGEVATVKVDGDKVRITFKQVKFKDPELLCTSTNKILMFRPDGSPAYHQNCRYTGKFVTIDSTPKPFFTYKHFAAGIAPKAFVKFTTDGFGEGYPIEVWATKDAKKLLAVMGMAVQ